MLVSLHLAIGYKNGPEKSTWTLLHVGQYVARKGLTVIVNKCSWAKLPTWSQKSELFVRITVPSSSVWPSDTAQFINLCPPTIFSKWNQHLVVQFTTFAFCRTQHILEVMNLSSWIFFKGPPYQQKANKILKWWILHWELKHHLKHLAESIPIIPSWWHKVRSWSTNRSYHTMWGPPVMFVG